MRSGAIHGYRGLIAEILRQIMKEIPSKSRTHLIATGGDAKLIAGSTGLFSAFRLPSLSKGSALSDAEIFPAEKLRYASQLLNS